MDIGSGSGRYSLELLKKGYQVELLHLSHEELNITKSNICEAGLVADAYHCMRFTRTMLQ